MVARIQDLSTVIGLSPLDLDGVQASVQAALQYRGRVRRSPRWDADGPVGDADTLVDYFAHVDRMMIQRRADMGLDFPVEAFRAAARADSARCVAQGLEPRYDAQTEPGRGGLPDDFVAIREQIMEEPLQPLTSEIFPTDTGVPFGAVKHRAKRRLYEGEAEIYRGSNQFPTVSSGIQEEDYGIVTLVCAVETDVFEAAAESFAGVSSFAADMRQARRAISQRANELFWSGNANAGIDGILNHRHLAKMPLGTDIVAGVTGETIARQMSRAANAPYIISGTAMQANALAVSPAIAAYINEAPYNSANSSNVSIAQYFLSSQARMGGVQRIEVAPELTGVGPNGEDGLFFYRDELSAVARVVVQDITPLPVWRPGPASTLTVLYAAYGGIVMHNAGNNVLAYARAEAL